MWRQPTIHTRLARSSSSRRSAPASVKSRRSRTPATARRCWRGSRISSACWWTGSNARCYDRRPPSVMKSENVVFAVAGVLFGLIAGWIIGAQQATSRAPAAAVSPPAAASGSATSSTRAAVIDEAQVQALKNVADREASNPAPRTQLANLYFDAERYDEAIKWYEQAIKLAPNDANLSTDLGVCYYYTNQFDKAL